MENREQNNAGQSNNQAAPILKAPHNIEAEQSVIGSRLLIRLPLPGSGSLKRKTSIDSHQVISSYFGVISRRTYRLGNSY